MNSFHHPDIKFTNQDKLGSPLSWLTSKRQKCDLQSRWVTDTRNPEWRASLWWKNSFSKFLGTCPWEQKLSLQIQLTDTAWEIGLHNGKLVQNDRHWKCFVFTKSQTSDYHLSLCQIGGCTYMESFLNFLMAVIHIKKWMKLTKVTGD